MLAFTKYELEVKYMMMFLGKIIEILDFKMKEPELYGWFHMLSLILMVLVTIILCVCGKHSTRKQVIQIIFRTAILVGILEIYKQINYTFSYEGGEILADYAWYAFPWQFCSMPMYVGLFAGIFREGRIHKSLCAFLATYSTFAGICVMIYPASVFTETIGINIQTMVCHGSMVAIGIFLMFSGYVKLDHRTFLDAFPVFLIAVSIAMILNEVAYRSGLLITDEFNMFFISPYLDSTLPVYSWVHGSIAYPWSLIVYVAGFSLAAYLILLFAMVIYKCTRYFGGK